MIERTYSAFVTHYADAIARKGLLSSAPAAVQTQAGEYAIKRRGRPEAARPGTA